MPQNEYPTFSLLRDMFRRVLPNSQTVILSLFLIIGTLLIVSLSNLLMPVFAAVVIAYLLEGLVKMAEQRKVPRLPAVLIVFISFLTGLSYILIVLMPVVSEQSVQLLQSIPDFIKGAQKEIMRLPELYPQFITDTRIRELMFSIQQELLKYSQDIISGSASSVLGLATAVVYLLLVPFMVFFFLKDKCVFLNWFEQFLPRDRHLTVRVWEEVDIQIGNYVRGKFIEVIILWFVSYIVYAAIGLDYAMLLAVLTGLSVIIPYVGLIVVTIPVLAVGYLQWGLYSDEFMYVVIAYTVIQSFDGGVLVPLLFSEAVNLHPVAIIIAILFFGGLWGFWGVFFAIPLATLVKAVISAWPRIDEPHNQDISPEGQG